MASQRLCTADDDKDRGGQKTLVPSALRNAPPSHRRRCWRLVANRLGHDRRAVGITVATPVQASRGRADGRPVPVGRRHRLADLHHASGSAVYLAGNQAIGYSVGTGGPIALINKTSKLYGSTTAAATLKSLMTGQSATNMLANEHARVSARALATYREVSALWRAPASNFSLFPSNNGLADQMKMVARMIAVS